MGLGHLAGIFWKMNKASWHFKENSWKCLLPVMKLEILENKIQEIHVAQ